MKTKAQAETQAQKLIDYNIKIATIILKEVVKLENKPRLKDVQKRINRMNKITMLKASALMYEKRGRKAWALYKNNPIYW